MRFKYLILLALLSGASLEAADPTPAKPAAPEQKPATPADQAWATIEALQKGPSQQPTSREEAIAQAKEALQKIKVATDAFVKDFPADPRQYTAQVYGIESAMQLANVPGGAQQTDADRASNEKTLATIMEDPKAPDDAKASAAFAKTMLMLQGLNVADPTVIDGFLKAANAFIEKYPTAREATQMRIQRIQVAMQKETPESKAVLTKEAAGSDRFAAVAKASLERWQKMDEVKGKPLELAFKSTDGKDIDIKNYRGKVVLVDFWASWCGPCMQAMPNLVKAYGELHDKGFEILGISLDQDKAAMDEAIKKAGITWPQGLDSENGSKITQNFGISAIPASFLVDKKGIVRQSTIGGESLVTEIQKLLAE